MLTTMKIAKGKSIGETISCSSCIVNFCAICLIKLQTQRPSPAQVSSGIVRGAQPIIKLKW